MSHIVTTTPLFVFLFSVLVFHGYRPSSVGSLAATVTYDGRALIINGRRRVLLSGSMHYPRSTPEVWPDLIAKAKGGGLDVIETYVFWNYHEPVRGQYYFEGRFDLVKFIKAVQDAGLYVHLRIGPYACAEWNYGGFPLWLHFIPGIQFRTTNTLFKVQISTGNGFPVEMKRFLTKIVGMMMENKLYASQGGPIILSQVENEYGNIEWAYGVGGELYVQWAAAAALDFNTSVPWVMCQQEDAPDPIINTCNGFYCDQFSPNSPSKPKIWTENYSGWFLSFGYAIPYRPVEDLAFSVARFFETGGTFQNYYMYFGGTNFGRTAGGPLIATSYDYDAPIDEYGFLRQPKWGHLRDLHQAIKLCEEYIVNSDPTYMHLGQNLEAHIYYKGHEGCAAFLANIDNTSDAYVTFNGSEYYLPAWSVSILPDCTNEIYNTAKVVSQWNLGDFSYNRTATIYQNLSSWSWYNEHVGIWSNNSFTTLGLLEQINTTKDVTDFLWYSTSIDLQGRNLRSKEVFLHVDSLGHAALLFVNKRLQGIWSGNHDDSSFIIHTKITLSAGNNTIDLLSMMIGVQNYGPWFDVAAAGVFSVSLIGMEKEDLSFMKWTYQIGVEGEYLGLYKSSEVNNPVWISGDRLPVNQSLIWYKVIINVPEGTGPLALNLGSMGKGRAWVNGQSIGRYWPAYLSPKTGCSAHCDYRGTYDSFKCLKSCGKPTQTLYHLPRSWVQSGDNLLILHEELGGDPTKITVITKTSQAVCINIAESDPPLVGMWKSMLSTPGKIASEAKLVCEQGWNITSIEFASFGTPEGECGKFTHGACSAESVQATVREACVGRRYCSFSVSTAVFGDPCPGLLKRLAIEAICGVSHNLS